MKLVINETKLLDNQNGTIKMNKLLIFESNLYQSHKKR